VTSKRLVRWAATASLGGFLLGYHAGVISGALLFVRREFDLGEFEQGALVGALALGAMLGGLLAARLADAIGRRRTLMLDAAVFILGAGLAAVAPSYEVLLATRVITAVAGGVAASTVPRYVSEISPEDMRGRLVTVNYVLLTLGIVAASCVDLVFASSESWRAMFAAGVLPAVALHLGMRRLPETAPWLDAHGHEEAAREVARQTVDRGDAERLLRDFRRARADQSGEMGWRRLLTSTARPALTIAVTLAAVQQFVGINAIIAYAPRIMEGTGLSASNSILFSVIIGTVNMASAVVSLQLIDRAGRRPLLLASLGGMLIALALLGLVFVASLGTAERWLSLVCILGYVLAFSIGMGPVFWLLVAEIFPPPARAVGAGVATTTNWVANFLVGLTFLPLARAVGQGETFWIFAACCLFGLWFAARYLPETKGRGFGQIDAEVRERWYRKRGLTLARPGPTER